MQLVQRVVDAVGWDGTIAVSNPSICTAKARSLDFDTLEFIHSRKTGALFVAAAAVGAMLANADAATLRRIEVYAKNLGLAFQITDDVLDVTADAKQLGKDVGLPPPNNPLPKTENPRVGGSIPSLGTTFPPSN